MEKNIIESVGKRIKELRNAKGISQLQLSVDADIDVSYIGQIERKGMNITINSLNQICKALGVSIEEFFLNPESSEKHKNNKNPIIKEFSTILNLKPQRIQKLLLELLKEIK